MIKGKDAKICLLPYDACREQRERLKFDGICALIVKPNQTLPDNGPGDPKPAHGYMERRRLSMRMHG